MKLCCFREPPSIPFIIMVFLSILPNFMQLMIMALNPNWLLEHWSVICKSFVENIFNLVLVIEKDRALLIDFKRIKEQLCIANTLSDDFFLGSHISLTWNTSILWCMITIITFLLRTMVIITTKALSLLPMP